MCRSQQVAGTVVILKCGCVVRYGLSSINYANGVHLHVDTCTRWMMPLCFGTLMKIKFRFINGFLLEFNLEGARTKVNIVIPFTKLFFQK